MEKIIKTCPGCGACENICPVNAIELRENKNGFLRPSLDSALCTQCGTCEKICPLINQTPPGEKQIEEPGVYAAYNLDETIRIKSSSGGIFDLVAREILGQGGRVFGAAFETDFSVSQKGIDNPCDLSDLRFSKYVQSHPGKTFHEAKQQLAAGRKVLYVGTPCIIGGLLSFLQTRRENLYTCSFICGSVPSRKVWRYYIEAQERRYGGRLETVCFRDKRKGWMSPSVVMEFDNGKTYASKHDWFKGGMVNKLLVNDACSHCHFRGINQLADIMLADFWGIEKFRPELAADPRGVSAVLVYTEQGEELFARCQDQMFCEKAPLELIVRCNQGLTGPNRGVVHPQSEELFQNIDSLPLEKIIRKYPTQHPLIKRAFWKAQGITQRAIRLARSFSVRSR